MKGEKKIKNLTQKRTDTKQIKKEETYKRTEKGIAKEIK